MIYPFITYAIEIWGKSWNTQLKRIKGIMNKRVKLIYINCSSKKAGYVNLNLFQFDEVYNSLVLIRLYKYINRKDNNFFKEQSRMDSITHLM